jgi:two-component sensor histidine kinase
MASMEHGEIRSFLEETRQKIRSIAIIHERLLQTGEINMVDISDYLGKLIVDLQMTASVEVTNINIETEIDPINLPLDVAINCGLILNEVLTNAFKHAFAGRSAGRIEVKLKKAEGGLLFTIQDDGIGLPENLRPGAGGFGMLMLEVFFNQLRAKVEILRSHGTGFLISFSTETKGDTL